MSLVSSAYAGHSGWSARRFFCVAVVAAVLLSGCVVGPRPSVLPPSEGEKASETLALNHTIALMAGQARAYGEYRIGSEDLLEIALFDFEPTGGDVRRIPARVSSTGHVTLPSVGKFQAAGRTPQGLEEDLRKAYKRFVHDPQVSVLITEYRSYRVTVVGFVRAPGMFELRGKKTLLEALAMAGGLQDNAGHMVRVSRQAGDEVNTVVIDLEKLTREGDVKLNLELISGDVLNVPEAGSFYVEGMVKSPGPYPLRRRTTVSQAIATAGGPEVHLARLSGITLYRSAEEGRRAYPVDIAGIRTGETDDIEILEDDIVFVPMSGTKFFVDRFIGGFGFGYTLN